MASNTALSYQMMIEEKLFSAMINGEQRGLYNIACYYARSYCKFLSISIDNIPTVSFNITTELDKQNAYLTNYFMLLDLIATTASEKIAQVRATYGNKGTDLLK